MSVAYAQKDIIFYNLNFNFMRKILLTVMAAVLTIGATAQNAQRTMRAEMRTGAQGMQIPFKAAPAKAAQNVKKIDTGAIRAVNKLTPAGTPSKYFLDYSVYAPILSDESGELLPVLHVENDIYFDGNDVYIPSMMFTDIFRDLGMEIPYVKGEMNGDKITVPAQQYLATLNDGRRDVNLCLGKVNEKSELENTPITFYVDNGVIYTMDVLAISDEEMQGYYAFCQDVAYVPADFFPASTTHSYTATDLMDKNKKINTTVEMCEVGLNDGGTGYYIKNLFPAYGDCWVLGLCDDNGSIVIPLQGVDESGFTAPIADNQVPVGDPVILEYGNGVYTSQTDFGMFVQQERGQVGVYCYYSNAVIDATAGIGSAVTEGKEAVGTELFDLSGRRVNGAQQGVVIKVTKYADGSSDATKIVR